MPSDQVVELIRRLLLESLLLSSPLLITTALVSVSISFVQTITGIQEQTLTVVPRLFVVFFLFIGFAPWFVHRLVEFTLHAWTGIDCRCL